MLRLSAIQPETATGKAKQLLDAVQAKLKITPNMTRVMANSPAVLETYLSFSGALAAELCLPNCARRSRWRWESKCVPVLRLRAHCDRQNDRAVGLRDRGGSRCQVWLIENAAALKFALRNRQQKRLTTDTDLQAVRAAGFTDGEIAEIIAHVALNIFTNYFNNAAEVEVDFPEDRSSSDRLKRLTMAGLRAGLQYRVRGG